MNKIKHVGKIPHFNDMDIAIYLWSYAWSITKTYKDIKGTNHVRELIPEYELSKWTCTTDELF